MMEARNLTCIGCPLGCPLTVEMTDNRILTITGNTCRRGADYARAEVTHPVRTVTSTVRVIDGIIPMVSVKTEQDVPKEKVMDVVESITHITVLAPIHRGDILLANAASTGVPIIATKDVGHV